MQPETVVGKNWGDWFGLHRIRVCATLLLIGVSLDCQSASTSSHEGIPSFAVSVTEGMLTVEAVDASLLALMQTIAERVGFRLTLTANPQTRVNASFERMPIDRGIATILTGVSSVIRHEGERIVAVTVLPRLGNGAPSDDSIISDGQETQTLEALAAQLDRESPGWVASIQALGNPDRPLVELVDLVAHDGDPANRRAAVIQLARKPAREALPGLSLALSDPDSVVRLQSVVALGRIAGDRAVGPLGQVLLSDPSPTIRRLAAERLGRFRDEVALTALRTATTDLDDGVRRAVEFALARLEGY